MDDFIKVVSENQAKVRSYIRTLGVRPDSIDDIAQEVFLTAYQKLDKFDQTREISSWLYGITRNLVNNERRKDARHARILNDNITEFMLDQAPDHSVAADQKDMIQVMNKCMEGLSDSSRDLLKHRYEEDKNSSEIAEVVQQKAATIRQSLRRIRDSLRDCIESKIGVLAYD